MERVLQDGEGLPDGEGLQDGEGWKINSGRQSHHTELLVLLGSSGFLWLLQLKVADVCLPSGLAVEFDTSRPPGSRLRRLDMVCTRCQVPRYQPVQDQEVYTVALPSYLVAGGDGYSMIAKEMLKHNSGEEEEEREGKRGEEEEEENKAPPTGRQQQLHLKVPLKVPLLPLQETWTCRWCRTTSPRSSRCFPPLKDASRCSAQLMDCRNLLPLWFLWFLCCCCSGGRRRRTFWPDL